MSDAIPERGYRAVAARLLADGAFVECVFHCPACGVGGTSLVRPAALAARGCHGCGAGVVVSVLPRA